MRQYLLTPQEKRIIQRYLETGEKLEGFRTLLTRCRRMQPVHNDLRFIEQLLAKTSKNTNNR